MMNDELWNDELVAEAALLNSPRNIAKKRAFARELRENPVKLRVVEIKLKALRDAFRNAERDPGQWLENPSVIDSLIQNIRKLAEFLDTKACPWLIPLLVEIMAIADRTRSTRIAMYSTRRIHTDLPS